MGTMLKYGSEGAKQFYEMFILDPAHAKAHREGDIHIHDLDFLTLTTTCCQIDLLKLFRDGFSTGHGFLREPNDIRSLRRAGVHRHPVEPERPARRSVSVPNFDYSHGAGCAQDLPQAVPRAISPRPSRCSARTTTTRSMRVALTERVEQETGKWACLAGGNGYDEAMAKALSETLDEKTVAKCMKFARKYADKENPQDAPIRRWRRCVHNLNTMHSRAGAHDVRSRSLNYGTDTSPEGRLVMEQLLLATEAGSGQR